MQFPFVVAFNGRSKGMRFSLVEIPGHFFWEVKCLVPRIPRYHVREAAGDAGHITLANQACKGRPYTHAMCWSECAGWKVSTMEQCWSKCVNNEMPQGCIDREIENSDCQAAVLTEDGTCHLYDSVCKETAWEEGTQTRLKKFKGSFELIERKRCSNSPYTDDAAVGCKGFEHSTAEKCKQSCLDSAQAPNCPQKQCAAGIFWEDTKVCHLYEQCSWVDASDGRPAQAIVQKNEFKTLVESRCTGRGYTNISCGGFTSVNTASECQDLCERSVASPCGTTGICRAAVYAKALKICHLYDKCEATIESHVTDEYNRWDLGTFSEEAPDLGRATWNTMISVLPPKYRGFKFYNGKECATASYTYDYNVNPPCNGFPNFDEYSCQAACENNQVAAYCPGNKICVAAVFHKQSKLCYLYETCPTLVDKPDAITIRVRGSRWLRNLFVNYLLVSL